MTPMYVICTGPNYNPGHVMRFEQQLRDHIAIDFKVHCYTSYEKHLFDKSIEVIPIQNDDGRRQWYKMDLFNIAPKGDVCFMSDLDWTFVGDVTDIFNVPVGPNELVAPWRWWTRYKGEGFTINGGLYKFIGGEFKYLPEVFHKQPRYWMQRYIIDLMVAHPPVNGEQNFVDETIRRFGGTLKYFEPRNAFARKPKNMTHAVEYNSLYQQEFGEDWVWMGDQFNPTVRMIQSIV